MKIIKCIKVIAINVATFVILLVIINWACGVYLKKSTRSTREELPNYQDNIEHARAVFADYNRIQHQYEPFVGWKTLPYEGKTTTISKEGRRIHQPVSPPENGKKVVRFFGGSTMWGEGSDDQHTIPALFNALRPEYAVHNHGQLAYNTRQELDELITLYSKNEKADIVIFYDGVNDAAFLCPEVIKELPAHRLVPMYREKLYRGKSTVIKTLMFEIFVEDILNVIRKTTTSPEEKTNLYDCDGNPKKAEAVAEILMKNWEMAHEIVTRRGGKFIAVLQPAAFIGNPKTDHLELDDELGENFREIYGRIKEKIAERDHSWIIDLSGKFDGDKHIYIDFCHVSPNGNQIIATEISEIVADMNGDMNRFRNGAANYSSASSW